MSHQQTKKEADRLRDVQTAIEVRKREQYGTKDGLAFVLARRFGWSSLHAQEIAKLAWVELDKG